MKSVVLAALLIISASLAGCLSEDEEETEDTEQPVLYGEIFWNQDGEGIIYQNDTGVEVRTLTENCEWGGDEIDGYCTIEWSGNINGITIEIEIKDNGEFYDYCVYFDSQSFCAELHLIDGGLVAITLTDNGEEKVCQVSSNTIGAPPADYAEKGYLAESASDWHSEFEEFVEDSEDAAIKLGCESIDYHPSYQDENDSDGNSEDCGETQEFASDENNSSFFVIEANPNPDSPGMKCFTKYVDVFGLGVYAESGLSDAQVLHAAAVLAELLDNDEDGVIDDQILFSRLENMSAIVPMFNSEEPDDSPALEDFMNNYNGNGVSAVLFADEVDPDQPMVWGSDATIEEIMHTINHIGHVYVYPDAFGLQPDSSLLSDAMDEARGGQFQSPPDNYPEDAWYHYDDTTCDYECMAIEYIYWAQVSNMDILNDTVTCDEIANEWEPCSKELLESMDVLIYALITDPQYHLPQNAPDGEYNPQTAEDDTEE
ncbi:MAG: hypothetical protein ACKVG2_04440 [Candidatus Poseidoniales archaeon]|jgi:hypothetical protein